MLTYDSLSRVVAQERNSKTLTKLPDDFFNDAKLYIESKSKVSGAKEDAWEIDNAKRLLSDMLEMRERKIMTLAIYFVRSGVTPGNLAAEENDFFAAMVAGLRQFADRKKLMVEGRPESRWTLAMLADIPQFLDTSLRKCGPYRKGDVATLSEEHARLLVEKGMAKRMEI
jgi:DNA replication initiation complex subunit (GINS family)